MRHLILVLAGAACLVATGCVGAGSEPTAAGDSRAAAAAAELPGISEAGAQLRADRGPVVLSAHATRLDDGTDEDLGRFRGQVVMLVNTASFCGYTGQYEGLDALHRARRADGFVVIGFPSNDFGGQEPGSSEDIREVCFRNYGVEFPVYTKVRVVGDDAHPVYRAIAAAGGPAAEPPSWNFTKYLIDREGRLAARFAPDVTPDDPRIAAAIDALADEGAAPILAAEPAA